MRIVGIIGSPRHGRNTAALVQEVLRGATSVGAETEAFYVNDLNLRPCQGCEACKGSGVCAHGDDMHILYDALTAAGGLVWGSPIYIDHVSAQTKMVLDRLYAFLGEGLESRFPKGVKSVTCLTWEAPNPNAYDDVADWLEARLQYYLEIETVARLTAGRTNLTPVQQRPELLKAAFDAGVRLVEAAQAGQ
ncbi:MAG: flavodoxin family protein [Chloroflexota bacterium]